MRDDRWFDIEISPDAAESIAEAYGACDATAFGRHVLAHARQCYPHILAGQGGCEWNEPAAPGRSIRVILTNLSDERSITVRTVAEHEALLKSCR